MNIPKPIEVGLESTIVADRIILADPRGIIPEAELQEFMETHVEPAFWVWMKKRSECANQVPISEEGSKAGE